MRRFLDTRLARVAKATAPRDLTEARQRSLLRARAAVRTLLRQRSVESDAGPAFAGAWQLGDAAAAELAGIPDTPDLRETDGALLAAITPERRRRSKHDCGTWRSTIATAA